MNKNQLLSIASVLIAALGAVMIYLGTKASLLPPTITGLGFLVIAFVFLGLRNR